LEEIAEIIQEKNKKIEKVEEDIAKLIEEKNKKIEKVE
jgi:hypothetical protein